MQRLNKLALFLLSAVLLPAAAWAQAGAGSVRGTVRDQSSAVIAGATVVLTNSATNVAAHTSSTAIGFYVFPAVVPGEYRLTVDAPGMQRFEATLTVQVQQAAVVDPVLGVAQASTAVTVQDVTPVVTADSPVIGHVLERRRIEQLPINGRGIGTLLNTVPGISTYYRAYGVRAGSTDTVVDGSSIADRTWGQSIAQVGLEAVEEFKFETSNSSAKFTRPATIVISGKSGTNQFHGSLFETHRNNAIGKARARQDLYTTAPPLIRNEYGGSAGGPVYLPKVYDGRNRTFWFFSYEGSRRTSPTTWTYTVPTEAMKRGDFSDLVDSQGRLYKLYDPWSTNTQTWARQPFAYGGKLNVIDPARMSPLAKFLFSITPAPTYPDVNPMIEPNLWVQVPQWANTYTFAGRLDHRISDNDRLFFRYNQGDSRSRITPPAANIGHGLTDPDVGIVVDSSSDQMAALGWTRNFSPTLFSELLITGNKIPYHRTSSDLSNWADKLGLPNPLGFGGFPQMMNTGLSTYQFNSGNYRNQTQGNLVVDDNFTKVAGRHELQFGGHFRYEQLNALIGTSNSMGNHTFDTLATALYDPSSSRTNPQATPFTGNNLANLFLGVTNYGVTFQRGAFYLRDQEYALYFQDNFKVSPRLTLNLGVRWEYWTEYREKNRLLTSFNPDQHAVLLGLDLDTMYAKQYTLPAIVNRYQALGAKFLTFKEAGLPNTLVDKNLFNFGPRLGFAYRLQEGARAAVLRGGYRISYFRIPLTIWIYNFAGDAPLTANLQNNLNNSALTPDGIGSYGMRSVPTVIAGVNSRDAVTLNSASILSRGSANARYFNPSQPDTRVQDWNITLEKEVFTDTLVRAAYIGNHVGRLPQYYSYNDATPTYIWLATTGTRPPTGEYSSVATRNFDKQVYGSISEFRKTGWSNFNGVQLELEHRYSKGFAFQLYYVLSNALGTGNQNVDDVSYVYGTNQYMPGIVPDNLDTRNRLLNYRRDTSVPQHQVRWNWLADLPFGRGKWLGRNAGGVLDRIIGGWQIAGMGSLRSNYFDLPTNIYPNGNNVEMYGYKYPIQDCRSGRCYPGYLWWNGYIPANQINSVDASGKPNGIMGVPANYKPAAEPLIPWPQNPNRNDPNYAYFGSNTVWVPLKDGTLERTTFGDGYHPWQNQILPSVRQWGIDASLFKVIRINERVSMRLNADFFNVLNMPGNPNTVGGDGILSTRNSGNSARQTQLTLRLIW